MTNTIDPHDEDAPRSTVGPVGAGAAAVSTWTVLFTDITASTAMRSRLGEDAFDGIRAEHDRLTNEAIAAHGGTVVKHTGDGVMAMFGGASEALSSAARLQRSLERRNRANDDQLSVRAGLSIGDAVVEGDDLHGLAVVEARRLCDAARPGEILCTELVRVAAGSRGSHRFGPITARDLKGLAGPLASCTLVWNDDEIGDGHGAGAPHFSVFGGISMQKDGRDVPLGGPKERAVLATLLAAEGAPVSVDALIDATWGDSPPRSATRTIHSYIARLRRAVGPSPDPERGLVTAGRTYALVVGRDQVDAAEFADLGVAGRALLEQGDPGAALNAFDRALAAWQGTPYEGLDEIDRCALAARSLDELRMLITEDRFDALLALGQSNELVADIERAVADAPLRERLWSQLMLALYRAGRQADALRAYQRARTTLADELGIEPGSALRELESAILDQDDLRLRRGAGGDRPVVAIPAALDVAGSALVGRAAEVARLEEMWAATEGGHGGLVSVIGLEGIGKTRLVAELAGTANAGRAIVGYARCDASHRAARALFDQALRSVGSSLMRAQSGALPGESLGTSIGRRLAAWAADTPVMLVLDDLHEADAEVLEVVSEIATGAADAPILVVAIFRTEPHDTNVRASGGHQIVLSGIDRSAVAQICALYGTDWTTEDIDRLHLESGGIPLAVHEEATSWVRSASSRRVSEAASQAQLAEFRLSTSQQAVVDEVVGIQRVVEERRRQLAARTPGVIASPCPYRGLMRFEADDAQWFFGRERLVAELAAHLVTRPVIAMVGASGSGKSSLVRAGLLPALAEGALPGSDRWRVVLTQPGAAPDADLRAALPDADADADAGRLLVVVDQLEELFTVCSDPLEREAFAQTLQEVVREGGAVIVAVRADQIGFVSEVPTLAGLIAGNDVLVGPIRERELRDVVVRPAQRAGLQLEDGLVDAILVDAQGSAGVLPLVQTALLETWIRRTGTVLTLGGYHASGGVHGAVARLAESTYGQLTESQQAAARRILLRLADASDDGTLDLRRRVHIEAVASRDDRDARVAYEQLVQHRLLTATEETVEVTHEALLREWPRLREWLADDVEGRRLHQRLGESARAWSLSDRDPSELLRGSRLSATLEWVANHDADLNDNEREFLDASRDLAGHEIAEANARADREIRTSQRLRRLLIGVALLLVVALVAGVVAVWQRNRADDSAAAAQGAGRAAEAERDQARIDRLVAESERELDSHLDLALLLAAEARRRDDSTATRGALLTALTHNLTSERLRPGASPSTGGQIQHTNSSFLGFLAGPRRLQYEADISADGRIVASAGRDTANTGGLTLVYDTTSRAEVGRIESDQPIWGVDVSPDGAFVLARGDESLYLFDTAQQTTTRLAVEVAAGDVFTSAQIQPGTTRVVAFTDQGTSQLWDWASETPVATTLPPGTVGRAAFLPDGSLVVDQPDAVALVWDVGAGRPQRVVDLETPPSFVGATAITADGRRLVGVEPAGRTYVWDLGTGQLVGAPATRPGTGRAIAASPTDASTIAIGSGGGGISLYDLDSEQVIGDRLYGHGSGIRDLTYSADGRYLVSVADDGLIGLWGDNDAAGLIAQPVAPDAHNIAYSADGRHALVRNAVTTRYEVRDAETLDEPGVVIQAPAGAPDRIGYGQLSADGSTVLAVTDEQPTGRLFASDAETGRPIWTLADADFAPGPPNVSPDGRVAVAVDFAFLRLRAWDITTGRRIGDVTIADVPELADGEAFAGVPQFSPDGKHLDVPANLGVARFRVDDLEPVAYVPVPGPFVVNQIESVPESDDVIAVGTGGELVRVDMVTSKVVAVGRSADPSNLAWAGVSSDGSLVAAYHGFSYHLALFDARTLQPVGKPFPVGDYIFDPTFTSDSRYLAANGLFFGLNHWDMDPDVWQEQACTAAGRNLTAAEWNTFIGADVPYETTCPRWPSADDPGSPE